MAKGAVFKLTRALNLNADLRFALVERGRDILLVDLYHLNAVF